MPIIIQQLLLMFYKRKNISCLHFKRQFKAWKKIFFSLNNFKQGRMVISHSKKGIYNIRENNVKTWFDFCVWIVLICLEQKKKNLNCKLKFIKESAFIYSDNRYVIKYGGGGKGWKNNPKKSSTTRVAK